ncbi:hypothetical protein AcW1_004009 [Taiwanofungus camphoratus]|nr:hypothetical protein AcW1_004009 [Antrodia cinnamomea]
MGVYTAPAMGGITTAALAKPLAPAVLGLAAGFSSIGPVAGTFAVAVQSAVGNVVVGSDFASAQAVAMGAALPVSAYLLAAVFGILIAIGLHTARKYRHKIARFCSTMFNRIRTFCARIWIRLGF